MDEQAELQEHQRTASVAPNPPACRPTQPPTQDPGADRGPRARGCSQQHKVNNRRAQSCCAVIDSFGTALRKTPACLRRALGYFMVPFKRHKAAKAERGLGLPVSRLRT
ncbi:uncharacterized protein ACO6RY_11362 [Pungitius sinensis]